MTAELMNPSVIMSIRSLELRAKLVVDGFRTGLNKSPRHGFSVEFSEYRQYSQGDDPRFLDWKLFARTDRSYIRLFEDETNLRCCIALDISRSMSFSSLSWTKLDYARTIAASLAWLLSRQGDAAGLTLFDSEVRAVIPARYRPGHLRRLMVALEESVSGAQTSPAAALEDIAQRFRKRGLVVLLSDLLTPVQELGDGLRLLKGCLHDVVVFQILDPAEKNLTFDGPRLFEDMESDQKVFADPNLVREEYRNRLEAHNAAIRTECEAIGASFRQIITDEPLELSLAEFLQARRQSGSMFGRRG
jgi:uncharacterized protein (DUF58 family)